jgi:hypothetical protein
MSHPNREEWMGFLYEDLDQADQLRLSAHLESCEPCKRQVAAWRGTMTRMDQWSLPQSSRWRPSRSWMPWAAAAALLLALGVTIGANSRSTPDIASIRKAIELEVQASVEKEMQRNWQARVEESVAAVRQKVTSDLQARIEKSAAEAEEMKAALADLSKSVAESRTRDKNELLTALRELESQRVADLITLRKDLETVAVHTEEGFKTLASITTRP